MTQPRVLYVTRKFPPSVGGMETLAFEIARALRDHTTTKVVALGRGQRNLLWFLPLATLRTAYAVGIRRIKTVVVGDPVTLLALWPALALRRQTRVVVVVHGLDLTLSNRSYRALVRRALRRADTVLAISHATKREAVAIGVDPDRIEVVPPGLPVPRVEDDARKRTAARHKLVTAAGAVEGSVIVATLGRLVERKGQAWFAAEVMPRLPERYVYVVAGAGPDRDAVLNAARQAGVMGRCKLLGLVDDDLREAVLLGADVFVVPNIPVPGDMEGFGLVAAEASLHGTNVVASRLEGLTDAVIDGETGVLCEPGDALAFANAVTTLAEEATDGRDATTIAATAALHFGIARFDRDIARVVGDGAGGSEPAGQATKSHALLDVDSRRRKARKLITIIDRRESLTGAHVLEVGTGSGVIAHELARAVGAEGRVVSVDVRDERVTTEDFDFLEVTDARLPFDDASFDAVVSNHVFEHVGDRSAQRMHLGELRRVLRPNGLVYLAVPNRWGLLEPHYRLPLLSWLPASAADVYVRATRRATHYDVRSPSRRTLQLLADDADLGFEECTVEAMYVLNEVEPSPLVRLLTRAPGPALRIGRFAAPTMVYVMRPR